MSSKKAKFNSLDKQYMRLAINLAKKNFGLTGLNPSVGCVIVKDDKIISHGVTDINGRPHAETIALKKNKKNVSGSTVYVTLEPCSHYGKTSPCTKSLVNAKVKKVIYSLNDIDLRTFNKAKKILNSNNIVTKSGLLKNQAQKIYKVYNFTKKNKLPYTIGKLACSSNLFLFKNNSFITNEHSRKISHLLRFRNQGILTSYKTINTDNPRLNCRISGLEKYSPVKIIIDKDLNINMKSYVLNYLKNFKTIIFHNSKKAKKINLLKKKGIKLIFLKIENNNYFDLKKILLKIYSLGIQTLLVECGKELTYKMISRKLFNEFFLFKGAKIIKNKQKIEVFNIKKKLNQKFKNKNLINTYLDKDKLIHYY